MKINKCVHGDTLEVEMSERFVFYDNELFDKLLKSLEVGTFRRAVFDVSGIDFVDSSALGMLLLARRECANLGMKLILRGATGQPKKMFENARFNTLFEME